MKKLIRESFEDRNKGKLNHTQYKALMILYFHHKLNPTYLSRYLNLKKGSFTPVVDSLIYLDFIKKEANRKDRRKYDLFLTQEGEDFIKNEILCLEDEIQRKIKKLDESDKEAFIKSISILEDVVNKL
jgi:DNA-binding MarR family transcriptional regulator